MNQRAVKFEDYNTNIVVKACQSSKRDSTVSLDDTAIGKFHYINHTRSMELAESVTTYINRGMLYTPFSRASVP